jgi:hypothetical protein
MWESTHVGVASVLLVVSLEYRYGATNLQAKTVQPNHVERWK